METDSNLSNLIEEVLGDLKDKIENGILNDVESNKKLNDQFMKMLDDSSSDSSSSSEDELDVKCIQNKKFTKKPADQDESDEEEDFKIRNQKYLKTKDEVTIDELGPVEYVEILLEPSVKLEKLGRVISKVDNKLVVIQSISDNPNKDPPKLDEDSHLFDSNRKYLGKIFETFGPVTNPFYVLRFNSLNEVQDRNLDLEISSEVYFAQSSQYTKFILNVDLLRRQKGSDASWSNDNEPPKECLDYSDDEQEKLAKKQLKSAKAKIAGSYTDSDPEDESVEAKSPQKTFVKKSVSNNSGFAQKRKHEQTFPKSKTFSNGQQFNNYSQQQPQQQPMMPGPYFYPGYPPQPYPYYANPQMVNYQYPPPGQMYPPQGFNYYQPPPPPNYNQNQAQASRPQQQHQQNIVDKRFIKNNNSNIVKKSF